MLGEGARTFQFDENFIYLLLVTLLMVISGSFIRQHGGTTEVVDLSQTPFADLFRLQVEIGRGVKAFAFVKRPPLTLQVIALGGAIGNETALTAAVGVKKNMANIISRFIQMNR